MNLTSTKKLNNGVEIPWLGLGVFLSKDGDETANAVEAALRVGYRHLDTAAVYGNEASVARGIRQSGVARKDIFLTTKLWNEDQRQGRQREAFEESLKKLETDYVDLYLIHWPVVEKIQESWKVMEELYQEGRIRAIGLSNFHKHHINKVLEIAKVQPAVNQIEFHPHLTQASLRAECEKLGIAFEAWSPLGGSRIANLREDPVLVEIGGRHDKSAAQVMLRWDLQHGVITIPKSVHAERIAQNADIFDFELTAEEMAAIDALNQDQRVGADPDNFNF